MKCVIPRFLSACVAFAALLPSVSAVSGDCSDRKCRPATVRDAIEMTRIHMALKEHRSVVAFAPDGTRAVTVTWRGDLETNTNRFALLLIDLTGKRPPSEVLSTSFAGDPLDEHASPIADLTFLQDGRHVAFLGRYGNTPAQVYKLDLQTNKTTRLTNHPSGIRSFVVGPDGRVRAFSSVAKRDAVDRLARLAEDGFSTSDTSIFPWEAHTQTSVNVLALTNSLVPMERLVRQYFTAGSNKPFFDSRQSRPAEPLDFSDSRVTQSPPGTLDDEIVHGPIAEFQGDPSGRYAVLYPYALSDHPMRPERYSFYDRWKDNAFALRLAAPYGLVDLKSGKVERLIDAPHPTFSAPGNGPAIWAPDSKSVLVFTLDPQRPEAPASWMEFVVATRKAVSVPVPEGWQAIALIKKGRELLLQKGNAFAAVARLGTGKWGDFRELGTAAEFDSWWKLASNGEVVVGVQSAPTTPPELVAMSLATGSRRVLTNLNPRLHGLEYGDVSEFKWFADRGRESSGLLIKPIGYQPGVRYPLVVLLSNGTLPKDALPYLLDAAVQLNGHAIQMLASEGFMVLYPRSAGLGPLLGTPEETPRFREHIETAIAELDRQGLIDPARMGISGWSRSAYYTEYLLMNSRYKFAAATTMDGGSREYLDKGRPYKDEEIARIRTPLLVEAYNLPQLVFAAEVADRMKANGQPVETWYYAKASHQLVRPQHRLRSLETHLDWWSFWLKTTERKGIGGPDQYPRWRALRALETEYLRRANVAASPRKAQ